MAKKKAKNLSSVANCHTVCGKCYGITLLVLGLFILANGIWELVGWGVFVGLAVIVKAVLVIIMPAGCNH